MGKTKIKTIDDSVEEEKQESRIKNQVSKQKAKGAGDGEEGIPAHDRRNEVTEDIRREAEPAGPADEESAKNKP